MTDINETIREYEANLAPIRRRIAELALRINGAEPLGPWETIKSLEARRYLLYMELNEMEYAICQLREYASRTTYRTRAG